MIIILLKKIIKFKKDLKKIKKQLKELNNKQLKFEDIFFILKIKIELFDYLNSDNELKNKNKLIDFPWI